MEIGFLIIGLVIVVLLSILGLHAYHDHKKINKAMRALSIPDKFRRYIQPYLLNIYTHHHNSMLNETDERFLARVQLEQPELLAKIQARVDNLTEIVVHNFYFGDCGPTLETC